VGHGAWRTDDEDEITKRQIAFALRATAGGTTFANPRRKTGEVLSVEAIAWRTDAVGSKEAANVAKRMAAYGATVANLTDERDAAGSYPLLTTTPRPIRGPRGAVVQGFIAVGDMNVGLGSEAAQSKRVLGDGCPLHPRFSG
jgi:hypothetical protein